MADGKKLSELDASVGDVPDAFYGISGDRSLRYSARQIADYGRPIASLEEAIEGISDELAMTPYLVDQYARENITPSVERAQQTANQAQVDATDAKQAKEPPVSYYPDYNSFINSPVYVDIASVGAIMGNESFRWIADPAGPIIAANGRRYKPDGPPQPQHFGAVGNGEADDSNAMQSWSEYIDVLRAQSPLVVTGAAGRYRMTRPLRFIRPASSGYRMTMELTQMEFICDFNRSEYPAFIEIGDRAAPAVYQAQYDLIGRILLRRGPNCEYAPIGIEAWGMAQSSMCRVDTSSWNNSLLVTHGAQNVTFNDLIFYSGGWSFGFKNAVGSAMSVTWAAGGLLTVVGGAMEFDQSWVGKTISLHTTESAYHVRITAVTSGTTATTDQPNPIQSSQSYTTSRIVRTGCCAVTTAAGSAVVAMDGDDTIGDHLIGLYVSIPRAGAGGKQLIAKIVATNGLDRTITLDRQASVTLNPVINPMTETTEIACAPVVTLSDTDIGIYSNGVSQVRFYNAQFETFRGVAMIFDDAELVTFLGCKFHGVQSNYAWNIHAVGAIWGNRLGGTFIGECDARYYGQFRFRFASQTQGFHFIDLSGRMATYEKLLQTAPMGAGFEAAVVSFGRVSMLGCLNGSGFSEVVTDENTPYPGYHPPFMFSKPDHDDIKNYSGPYHLFQRDGAFSIGDGRVEYSPSLNMTTTRGRTRFFGQNQSVEVWDSDITGYTWFRMCNSGGADMFSIRNQSSAPRADLMIASNSLIAMDGTGLGFFGNAPVARPSSVPITAEGIHAALVQLGLII